MAEKIIINEIELFQINDFADYYISRNADIYSKLTEKFLTPQLINKGYYRVGLCKNGVQNHKRVHRLLAEAFIPNDDPANKPEIDHINRIPTDNRLENLKWSDRTEQMFNRGLFKNNTSGVKGIYKDGNSIRAHWRENGIGKTKRFNINKFGYDGAFELAKECRKSKMLELYNIIE